MPWIDENLGHTPSDLTQIATNNCKSILNNLAGMSACISSADLLPQVRCLLEIWIGKYLVKSYYSSRLKCDFKKYLASM